MSKRSAFIAASVVAIMSISTLNGVANAAGPTVSNQTIALQPHSCNATPDDDPTNDCIVETNPNEFSSYGPSNYSDTMSKSVIRTNYFDSVDASNCPLNKCGGVYVTKNKAGKKVLAIKLLPGQTIVNSDFFYTSKTMETLSLTWNSKKLLPLTTTHIIDGKKVTFILRAYVSINDANHASLDNTDCCG